MEDNLKALKDLVFKSMKKQEQEKKSSTLPAESSSEVHEDNTTSTSDLSLSEDREEGELSDTEESSSKKTQNTEYIPPLPKYVPPNNDVGSSDPGTALSNLSKRYTLKETTVLSSISSQSSAVVANTTSIAMDIDEPASIVKSPDEKEKRSGKREELRRSLTSDDDAYSMLLRKHNERKEREARERERKEQRAREREQRERERERERW